MSDLLSVPLKKASDVDLIKPLKNIIASLYSTADTPADFTSALSEFNKLRTQALSKTLDKSLPALEVLYKYHDQIAALETKIPAHEVQIPFKWKDAFDKGSLFGGKVSATVTSLGFEKVCVLYNVAALQSQVGALGRISDTDEELKSAAKLFQSSSGIFAQLKSAASVMGGQEPTPDLNPETLTALSNLMLAQAQEIFVTKTVQDRMKDATIAKVCAQCEDMYAETLRTLQRDTVKHLWEKEWIPIVAGKQAAFSGLTHYFQSNVCASKKQIGEQIARLQVCLESLKQAQQRSGVPNFFSDYVNKATRQLNEAKKDNDFIYHERIPDAGSLAVVEKVQSARLAKSFPPTERLSSQFKDLFDNLVPVAIHQAMAACDVRKTEIVNTNVGKLRESTQLLNSVLASLNLPAAVEDVQGSADDVPQSLKEKARQVAQNGGIGELHRLINEIPELVQRNKEILDEADRLLREEEESDQQLRSQLKEKWTRTSSDKLNSTFKTNSARYREIIDNALNADEVVKQKFASHRQAMEILSAGEHGLTQSIPKQSGNKETGSASARDNLKQLMHEVDLIKREREALENNIKSLSFDLKAPFLTALAQDGAIDEPVISVHLLGNNYGHLEAQVQESLSKQEKLIVNIQTNSDEFFGRSGNGGGGGEREQVMRQLAEGFDAFTDLQNNIKEGTKFYNDLTQLLLAFQNKISDYCFARKTEKEELLKDVTRDASQPAAPPPRPPQPTAPLNSSPQPPYATLPAAAGHSVPYPTQSYGTMPMPYQQQQAAAPYPMYTPAPMPAGYNPYGTYAPVPQQNYAYPVQPMGYPAPGYYQQQQQHPPPQ